MEHTAPTPRTDTRSRVQKVALELFAEQGYEKTSLREIAERLGVTKAALYYHFKSKEDIVHSFTDDYFAELDALLDWAKDQPRDEASRRELLDRYVGVVLASNEVFRFLEQNRAAVQSMEAGKERFARVRVRLEGLVDVLVGSDAPLRDRVRATTAVLSVGATCMFFLQEVDDRDKLRAIVLEMATDLIPVTRLSRSGGRHPQPSLNRGGSDHGNLAGHCAPPSRPRRRRRMRYLDVGTGKRISKIGLGTHQFGSSDWNYGERYARHVARDIVRRALELGVTLFDTAETYGYEPHRIARRAMLEGVALTDMARTRGFGRSEEILGRSLGQQRESAFLITKFYPSVLPGAAPEQRAVASANRLRTRYIDLYQVHQPPHIATPDGVLRAIRALQQTGMVREIGVSNASLARWRATEQALGRPVLSNQVGYSLVSRSAERDLLPFAALQRRVVIAYRPLELGLLSGTYSPANQPADRMRTTHPLFLPENLERICGLIAALREVADAHAATPAQVALAWVIRHPAVAAIPGASSVEQLERNVAAADIDLADDEYRALQLAAARFRPVSGPGFVARQVRSLSGQWRLALGRKTLPSS